MIASSRLIEICREKRLFWSEIELCRPPAARNVRELWWSLYVLIQLMQSDSREWMAAVYPDRVVLGPRPGFRLRMDVEASHIIHFDGFGTLQTWAEGGAL